MVDVTRGVVSVMEEWVKHIARDGNKTKDTPALTTDWSLQRRDSKNPKMVASYVPN